jgi:NTE family protein
MGDTPTSLAHEPSPALEPDRASRAQPLRGTGLCLSGGGYRAMLFHAGTLWRLNELGMLPGLARISSVSGGSITAGVLAHKWGRLKFDDAGVATNFEAEVIAPVRCLAGVTIDAWAIGIGALNPCSSIGEEVQAAYCKHLFGDATLQDLPDSPRFVINATNVQSGALFRFSKQYMGDWRIGLVRRPAVSLALAVAASSAFPPVLSPVSIKLSPSDFAPPDPDGPPELTDDDFRTRIVLSDGGVYDNLGLETVWKRCETILVSDAGQKLTDEGAPAGDWARHAIRVLNVIDNQVRSLRKRMLISAYVRGERKGAFWGVRTDVADYGLEDALPCPHARTLALAATPTRLACTGERLQEQLINWGYAACDVGVRGYVLRGACAPSAFPYPRAGV